MLEKCLQINKSMKLINNCTYSSHMDSILITVFNSFVGAPHAFQNKRASVCSGIYDSVNPLGEGYLLNLRYFSHWSFINLLNMNNFLKLEMTPKLRVWEAGYGRQFVLVKKHRF